MNTQLARQLKLKVADIIIEARCADPDTGLVISSPPSQSFLVMDGQPDCILNVHYGSFPDIVLERQLFNSGDGPWALYSSGKKIVFQQLYGHGQPHPYRMTVFEPEFDRGELFIRPNYQLLDVTHPLPPEKEKISLDPFLYPLDEWLIVNLLSQGRGLHIHALGVVHEGQGLVFCGFSGAGKSTLAELWKKHPVRILSDDRIALRKQDGRMWVYGTPWHGDARISLPEKAPLKVLYFITHGQENRILPLNINEVAIRLLVRCFPTFYRQQGMEYALSFITELAQEVPCYELQFTPDQRAVDVVSSHVESHTL
jgi:hypothetical protein